MCFETLFSVTQITVGEELEEVTPFLLQHESSAKLAWDIFMVALIIFAAFVNPLQIGETKDRRNTETK